MKNYTGLFIFAVCMPMVMFGMNEGEGFASDVAASLYGKDVSGMENDNPNKKRERINYQPYNNESEVRAAPHKKNKINCTQQDSERNRPTLSYYAFRGEEKLGEIAKGAKIIAPRQERVKAYEAAIDAMNAQLVRLETREQRLAEMNNLSREIDKLIDELKQIFRLMKAHGRAPADIKRVEEITAGWQDEFCCLNRGIERQTPWTEQYLSHITRNLIENSRVVQKWLSFELSGEEKSN